MLDLRRVATGLAAGVAVLAATPAISADAPPNPHSLELAHKLFSEMQMDQLVSGVMRQMMPTMMAQARKANPNLTDEQAKAITDAVSESAQAMMLKINDKVAPLYAETFTEKELQDLVAFYDSPGGRAMIAKMPVMMTKVGPVVTQMMPEMIADMTQRVCAKTDCSKMNAPGKPGA